MKKTEFMEPPGITISQNVADLDFSLNSMHLKPDSTNVTHKKHVRQIFDDISMSVISFLGTQSFNAICCFFSIDHCIL